MTDFCFLSSTYLKNIELKYYSHLIHKSLLHNISPLQFLELNPIKHFYAILDTNIRIINKNNVNK